MPSEELAIDAGLNMHIATWMFLCIAGLLLSGYSFADEALARQHTYMSCHAIDRKLVGPAYRDVARRYADQANAAAVLEAKVRRGGSGVWGPVPMPSHPNVPDADMKKLVNWILAIDGATPAASRASQTGSSGSSSDSRAHSSIANKLVDEAKAASAKLKSAERVAIRKQFATAFTLFQSGDFAAAKIGFEQGLSKDPANGIAHYYLAETLVRLKKQGDAQEHYELTIALSPSTPEALKAKAALDSMPKEWIADKNGCKAWNPRPQPNESFEWSGNCNGGYAEGRGTVSWFLDGKSNGYLEASLRKGKAQGACLSVFGNGERKEGECIDGKMQGKGTHTFPNGDRFEGNFVDGLYNGFGVMTSHDGGRYEGEFKNGKPEGKGIGTKADGARCEGEFKNGKSEGRSICTTAKGTRIDGNFLKGNLDGEVSINFARGDWFKGRFRDGLPNGVGSYYNTVSGNTYTGEFKNGCYRDPYDSTRVAAVWVEPNKCGF